jgi:hypothetical protein
VIVRNKGDFVAVDDHAAFPPERQVNALFSKFDGQAVPASVALLLRLLPSRPDLDLGDLAGHRDRALATGPMTLDTFRDVQA